MVFSASEYSLVTRYTSPVPSFFHSCPIRIFETLIRQGLTLEGAAKCVNNCTTDLRAGSTCQGAEQFALGIPPNDTVRGS